jgi:hypothetical protein
MSAVVRELLDRALRRKARGSPWDSEELIREELFSAERLEQHAESLALAQRVAVTRRATHSLSRRLADNSRVLLDAYHAIASVIDQGYPITPAAEWLVDNFHVVEDQIREVRLDLPAGYYRQLPKLADGPFAVPVRARLPARAATHDRRGAGGRFAPVAKRVPSRWRARFALPDQRRWGSAGSASANRRSTCALA